MERMVAAGRLGPPLVFMSGVPSICSTINRKDSRYGMVGLEYIVELVSVSRNDPSVSYECVLCLKSMSHKGSAVYHVVNYVHKVNYLRSHFPRSLEPLLPYMQLTNGKWRFDKPQVRNALRHICWRIEERFGRPVPAMIRVDNYLRSKAQYVRRIEDGPHFEEDVPVPLLREFYRAIPDAVRNNDDGFDDRMGDDHQSDPDEQHHGYEDYDEDEEPFDGDDPADDRHADEAPSLSVTVSTGNSKNKSSSSTSATVEKVPSHSTIPKQASPPNSSSLPAAGAANASASATASITAEVYANYKRQLDKVSVELQAKLLKYETKPEFHPLYPGEWKTFWSRRSAELHEEGKDTTEYDFSTDWTRFWLERVIELNEEELERADRRIRRELDLPLSGPIVEPAPPVVVVEQPVAVTKRSAAGQNVAPTVAHSASTTDSRDRDRRKREQVADERRAAKSPERRRTEKGGGSNNASSSSNNTKRSSHTDRDRSPAGRSKDYHSERSSTHHRQQESSKSSTTSSRDHHRSAPNSSTTTKRSTVSHVEPISDEDNLPTAADLNLDDLEVTNEPVTVISVLRLLSAFEDLLGSSLGPRVVDLLSKAVALEKVKANLADELLMSAENSVLLDTVKEKLKGLLLAGVVEQFKVRSVRKVIAHVNSITKIIDRQTKLKEEQNMAEARLNMERMKEQERLADELRKQREAEQKKRDEAESRALVMKQLATSITLQGKMITKEQLEALTDVYIQNHSADDTPYLFGLQMGSRFPDLKEDAVAEVPVPVPQPHVQEFPDQHPMLWNAHHQPQAAHNPQQQYGQYGTQYNAAQQQQQPLYNAHGFYNNQQPIQQQQQQQQQQLMVQQQQQQLQQQHLVQQQHSAVNMRPNLSEIRTTASGSRRQRRDDQQEQNLAATSYERRVTLPFGQQPNKTASNGNRFAPKAHEHQRGSGHRPSSGSRSRTSQAANGGGYTSGSSSNSYSGGGGAGSGSRSSGYY